MLLYNFVLEVSLTFANSQLYRRLMSELTADWRLVLVSDIITSSGGRRNVTLPIESISRNPLKQSGKTHQFLVNLSNSRRNLTFSLGCDGMLEYTASFIPPAEGVEAIIHVSV